MGTMLQRATLALLLGGLAACSSVGDEGATGGNDAGGLTAPPPDSTEARVCSTDDDCLVDVYDRPVASTADCYCPTCPSVPLNRATAMSYEIEWDLLCRDYAPSAHCLAIPCPAPPRPQCMSGLCQAVTPFPEPRAEPLARPL